MSDSSNVSDRHVEPLDQFALDLQQLRLSIGTSYGALAEQVTDLRTERGLSEAAARTPRSTVYNCFTTGRARLDIQLLRDIVQALTGDEEEAERWVEQYLVAQRESAKQANQNEAATNASDRPTPEPSATQDSPADQDQQAIQDEQPGQKATGEPHPHIADKQPARKSNVPEVVPTDNSSDNSPTANTSRIAGTARTIHLNWPVQLLIILLCVLLNRAGLFVSETFTVGLFLDMIGTCIAAIMLGPWQGALVGLVSSGLMELNPPHPGTVFVLVNITGALLWGYGVRRFNMGNDFRRFVRLGMLIGLICSCLGTPLGLMVRELNESGALDGPVSALQEAGVPLVVALGLLNVVYSVLDKILAGTIALVIYAQLARFFHFPADHMPLVQQLAAWSLPPRTSEGMNRAR